MSSEPAPTPIDIPADVPRVYANYIALYPGGMDVTIGLGHQIAGNEPEWQVQVTMSWEEAKFLIAAVQDSITGHEAAFGEVRNVMKRAHEALAQLQAAGGGSEVGDEDA